jgi:hypothetical protein
VRFPDPEGPVLRTRPAAPDGPECLEECCPRPPYREGRCKVHADIYDYRYPKRQEQGD